MVEGCIITRGNEDVSNFLIGEFGDKRLRAIGALLFKRICNKLTTCIKDLAGNRALEVGFGRFLRNEKVSIIEIETDLSKKTSQNCKDKSHVLAIGDTVEVTFPGHKVKKNKFGFVSDKKTKGFLAHPVVVVDADSKDILGLSSIEVWSRTNEDIVPRDQRLIEDKESYKWIHAAQNTNKNIKNPDKITMIYDREGDIFELFDRVPNERIELLVRSNYDRKIFGSPEFLSEHMDSLNVSSEYQIELPAITGKRTARTATMTLKFSTVTIQKPQKLKDNFKNEMIEMTCVEATEISIPPANETPVYWRILTTHKVTNAEEALQIVIWYTWRWTIEQVFRTVKTKGFDIESSSIEDPEILLKIFILGLAAAVQVMMLVHARDGLTNRPASDIFNKTEIVVLHEVVTNLEGKTVKQQNPFQINSLSWASWIIARLGGWLGYRNKKASPPGPITMHKGLTVFNNYMDAWILFQAKDVCIG